MNWRALIALGLGQLRLPPETFWSLTPRELRAMLGPPTEPMTRAALDALAARFPDDPVTGNPVTEGP